MLKYIRLLVLVFIFTGCVPVATTSNPISPELDSPIVLGEVTPAPWGCVKWRKTTEVEGVWSVESKCCPLKKEKETEDWVLKGWDC